MSEKKWVVGDRVAVYGVDEEGAPLRLVGRIGLFFGDGTFTVLPVEDGPSLVEAGRYDFSVAHPKQCRRINS